MVYQNNSWTLLKTRHNNILDIPLYLVCDIAEIGKRFIMSPRLIKGSVVFWKPVGRVFNNVRPVRLEA